MRSALATVSVFITYGLMIGLSPAAAVAQGLVVLPARLDLGEVLPGTTTRVVLNVTTQSGTVEVVAIGEIETWIHVDGATLPVVSSLDPDSGSVVIDISVPRSAASGVVGGYVRLTETGAGSTALSYDVPLSLTVLDSGLAPAELVAEGLRVEQRQGATGFVAAAVIANRGDIDAKSAIAITIEDADGEIRHVDLGRISVPAGNSVEVEDLIGLELAPGKYQATLAILDHPNGSTTSSFTATADASERGRVVSMSLLGDEASGGATLELVFEHPGSKPALVEILATVDGLTVVDKAVVASPGDDEIKFLFPIAAEPDGTRMQVSTSWNNEPIDDRALTFGDSGNGLTGTWTLIAAALVIGASGSGLVRAGRRRAEGST